MDRRTFLRAAAVASLTTWWTRPVLGDVAQSMHRRPIPSSGEALPVVGLGTWQNFDVSPSDTGTMDRLADVVGILFEHGGAVIDSSPMYGRAEEVVGRLLARDDLARDDAFLATKVWTSGRDAGVRQMRDSAAKMAGDGTIDLMQVHNLVDWRAHLDTLRAMKRDGRIRYVGLTHYTDRGVDELVGIVRAQEGIDFVQCAYSIGVRAAERELFPLCAERGVAVIVNRPFEGGAAFRRTRGRAVPTWAREDLGVESWAQFSLKFVLGDPRVTCVIPGTGNPVHARDNVRGGLGPLPDDAQRARMSAWWDELG